jgi:large subunit ribosomal protein L29
MQAQEIRGMSSEEIGRRLDDSYQELFNLRFQMVTGQLKNHNRLTEVKRDISRMKTILREREMAEEGSPS